MLSFVFLGIYWNNHHHMLHADQQVNGAILWANLHLLFWLSLIPFATGWMGENHFAALPTAAYGVVLLLAGVAYTDPAARRSSLGSATTTRRSPRAIGQRLSRASSRSLLYARSIPLAFVAHVDRAWRSTCSVALMWLVPDRRIERVLSSSK